MQYKVKIEKSNYKLAATFKQYYFQRVEEVPVLGVEKDKNILQDSNINMTDEIFYALQNQEWVNIDSVAYQLISHSTFFIDGSEWVEVILREEVSSIKIDSENIADVNQAVRDWSEKRGQTLQNRQKELSPKRWNK